MHLKKRNFIYASVALFALGISCRHKEDETLPTPIPKAETAVEETLDSSYVIRPDLRKPDTVRNYYTFQEGALVRIRTRSTRDTSIQLCSYDSRGKLAEYVSKSGPARTSVHILTNQEGQISQVQSVRRAPTVFDSTVFSLSYDAEHRPSHQIKERFISRSRVFSDTSKFNYTTAGRLHTLFNSGQYYRQLYRDTVFMTYTADSTRLYSMDYKGVGLGPLYYSDLLSARPWFIQGIAFQNLLAFPLWVGYNLPVSIIHDTQGPFSHILEFYSPSWSRDRVPPSYTVFKNSIGRKRIYALAHEGWDMYVYFTTVKEL